MSPSPRTTELSAITKTYDFVLWLLPHIAKFPSDHRFTLGNRLEEGVLDILETLIEASYTREKVPLLQNANIRLERLRYLLRITKDLHLISIKQYEFAAESLFAIGTEVGGWLKRQSAKQITP